MGRKSHKHGSKNIGLTDGSQVLYQTQVTLGFAHFNFHSYDALILRLHWLLLVK